MAARRARKKESPVTPKSHRAPELPLWTLGTTGTNPMKATASGAGIANNPVTFHATGI
jgi:hypothetical protein